MTDFEVKISSTINPEAHREITNLLNAYNTEQAPNLPFEAPQDVEILLYEKDILLGGIIGKSQWGTLEVKKLAVNTDYRHHGIGTQLMNLAEEEAKRRNCKYVSLSTFSYQAPKFYEKLGFTKIGTEEDFPVGFERYFYQKKI